MKKHHQITFMCIAFALLYGGYSYAQSYVPKQHDKHIKINPIVKPAAFAVDMRDVQLLESPFKTAMEKDAAYLWAVDADRLLAGFRAHSGLKPRAAMYGGWESSGLAGHTLGHYLSAVALHYASSGDQRFLDRISYMVKELKACQVARKTGYIGAIPKEDTIWTEVGSGKIRSSGFDLNGGWSPWYTVHKIFAGLLDVYLYTDNKEALEIAKGLGNWTTDLLKDLTDEQLQAMLRCEYGGMAETLVNLFAITGDTRYLTTSYKFYDKQILDPLANNTNVLPGKHSNTQIPKVIAGIRRFELTGAQKDRDIAVNFWNMIVRNHSYATGGNSNYEYLGQPGKLNDQLTDNTTETCNTYNMLKLTRHLFALNPSAGLMDYYEKALYNHILASQNHETGMMCYFVPLRMGGKKEYSSPFDTFTCCVGSGMENHVKYNEAIYARGADGSLMINLFIPSVFNDTVKGFSLMQDGFLPGDDQVVISVRTGKSVNLKLKLRKPYWAVSCKIQVNGVIQASRPDAQGYFTLKRQWRNNDTITFSPVANIHAEAMPDNPQRKALFYGPVLLAGTLGRTEPDPMRGIPVFVTGTANPDQWLKRSDAKILEFNTGTNSQPGGIKLIPFHQTGNEYYSVYWDFFTPQSWDIAQQGYQAEKKKQLDMEARTTDLIRLGEMQPERDHFFKGEHAVTGEDHQRKWRMAENGGFISYELKTDQLAHHSLVNIYWGMDNRGRKFDIFVDEVKIATEDLNKYKESRFYTIDYPIPTELTRDKTKVTIKLMAQPGQSAGPVYGSRLVKD